MIMAQNEETLYFNNTHPEVRQESKDKTQNAADKATWKKVAVGGAAHAAESCAREPPRGIVGVGNDDCPDGESECEGESEQT